MLKKLNPETTEILELADFLENLPSSKYDQAFWGGGAPECKTPACIWGWHAHLRGYRVEGTNFSNKFLKALGLTTGQFTSLVDSHPLGLSLAPTRKGAARVLRHLAITGEVNWELARADATPRKD